LSNSSIIDNGFNIIFRSIDKVVDKKAYYKKDYSAARKNIDLFCDKLMSNEEDIKAGKKYPNITEEQRESIINFFEKYWELLCNNKDSKPKVALIPKKIVEGNKFLWNNFTDYKK
jgi:hypothetical protein